MPGFIVLLTLLFIAFKITGIIAWPWVWVLAPMWASPLILFAFMVSLGVVAMVDK